MLALQNSPIREVFLYDFYLSYVIRWIQSYKPRKDESRNYRGQCEGEKVEIKRLLVLEDVHHFAFVS